MEDEQDQLEESEQPDWSGHTHDWDDSVDGMQTCRSCGLSLPTDVIEET